MKNIVSFGSLLIFFTFIIFCAFSCEKDKPPYQNLWLGAYMGKDVQKITGNSGTPFTESVDIKVVIADNPDKTDDHEMLITITLLYDNVAPYEIFLTGIDRNNTFEIYDKIDADRENQQGASYRASYSMGTGRRLNQSGNIGIAFEEMRSFYNPDLQSLNFTSLHSIELDL